MEGKVSTYGAQKVFDRMPGSPSDVVQQEEVPNCILRVAIHEVIYPMTEEVLHLVFDPYGSEKGVLMMVLEKIDHVLVFVAFPSPHEARRAWEALHGRNIYDGCCRMDIKYSTPPLVRNTTVTAPTPTSTQPVPCSASTLKAVNLSESGVTAMVGVHPRPLHHSVALAAAATSPKLPATDEPLGANQVLDRMPVVTDDKELVQVEVKKEQLSVPGVFNRTHERITSEPKFCRLVKWVSRVRIARRRVRWAPRSKFCNSTTMPTPPIASPHPPDPPVHSLDPCSPPQPPAPPDPPEPLSGIGFVFPNRIPVCHTTQATYLSSEQQKSGKMQGDGYMLERLLGSATGAMIVEECFLLNDGFFRVGGLQELVVIQVGARLVWGSQCSQLMREKYMGCSNDLYGTSKQQNKLNTTILHIDYGHTEMDMLHRLCDPANRVKDLPHLFRMYNFVILLRCNRELMLLGTRPWCRSASNTGRITDHAFYRAMNFFGGTDSVLLTFGCAGSDRRGEDIGSSTLEKDHLTSNSKQCEVLVLMMDHSVMSLPELRPWPDPHQNQSSRSMMNGFPHSELWVLMLASVCKSNQVVVSNAIPCWERNVFSPGSTFAMFENLLYWSSDQLEYLISWYSSLVSVAKVLQKVSPCNGNPFSPSITDISADSGILLAPHSNWALINHVYEGDSVQAFEIRYERQLYLGSISNSVDRTHMMMHLLSKNIDSVQHILDFSMQKVTQLAATLWDPGIFAVHFVGHLNLLGRDGILGMFSSAMRLCSHHDNFTIDQQLPYYWRHHNTTYVIQPYPRVLISLEALCIILLEAMGLAHKQNISLFPWDPGTHEDMLQELIFLLPYSTNELRNETLPDALGRAGGGPEIIHMLGIEMKKSTPIKQYHNGVDYQCAVQFCCYLELGGRRVIDTLLRHTNQQTMQVRRIIAYLCSREHVHALYQSVYVWPLDSSSLFCVSDGNIIM